MAFPQVAGSIVGQDASRTFYHTITFPSGLNKNDLILGIVCNAPDVTTNWGSFSIYSSSGNFEVNTYNFGWPYVGFNSAIICGLAKGSGADSLVLRSTSATSCIARWQIYNITGHNNYTLTSLKHAINTGDYSDGYFTSEVVPPSDDSVSADYLYMQFVTYNAWDPYPYPDDFPCTTLVQPTSWTNLLHDGKDSNYEASIASCRRESTSSQLSYTVWENDPLKNYIVTSFRISPGTLGGVAGSNPGFGTQVLAITGETDSGPTGFNVWVYSDSIGHSTAASVAIEPYDQVYDNMGAPSIDNPFGSSIKITSSGSWTATWLGTGYYFIAASYSGSAGVTYLSIACNIQNTTPNPFTDTLQVTCGGATATVVLTQGGV
jgi:hypothetical protein